MREFLKNVIPYVVIIVVVLLIKFFVVTPVIVSGTSMNPTLEEGNILLLNKLAYNFSNIKRFDIVVISRKVTGSEIIKRVIGLPGDKLKYEDGNLYINDELVEENFKHQATADYEYKDGSVIPDGNYLVIGDNRTSSYDSRYFGLVKKEYIEGRIEFSIFPPQNIK